MTTQGLTTIQSNFGPKDTMNRLEAAVQAKGMTVFARIDHAAGATAVGLSLRPTEVLIFGNAKGGTLDEFSPDDRTGPAAEAVRVFRTTILPGWRRGTGSAVRRPGRSATCPPRWMPSRKPPPRH